MSLNRLWQASAPVLARFRTRARVNANEPAVAVRGLAADAPDVRRTRACEWYNGCLSWLYNKASTGKRARDNILFTVVMIKTFARLHTEKGM
jgi:hypothetical protein